MSEVAGVVDAVKLQYHFALPVGWRILCEDGRVWMERI